ncbi:MAG: TolC family protein [Coleofasciculaceae cyanobacterium SM2_1_6]|nr:TolC family protein [Coleofasciculaceae cyanobacterium SM2_1_6]
MRSFSLFVAITTLTLLPATVVNATDSSLNNNVDGSTNPVFRANVRADVRAENLGTENFEVENPSHRNLAGEVVTEAALDPLLAPVVNSAEECVLLQTELRNQGNQLNPVNSCSAPGQLAQSNTAPNTSSNLPNSPSIPQNIPQNITQVPPLVAPTNTGLTTSLTTGIPGFNPPEFLNPSNNPLLFPTIPEEVLVDINEPITLEQAVILARRNNPLVSQAQVAIERAEARLRETYASEFPTGTVTFDFTRSESASARLSADRQAEITGVRQGIGSTSAQANLQLDYNLYTGGRRPATISLAAAQLRNAQLALEAQLVQLRLDVANDYYSLQQANSQLIITRASVEQAQVSLRDAQNRERAGVGTRFEVLQAEVALANAAQDERNAVAQQSIASRQLAQRLNLPQTVTIVADEINALGDWPLNLEESIVLAFKNRAEIEQQLLEIEQAEAQQRIATADTLPQVNLFANYGVVGNLGDGANTAGGGSVGIRAQWTFF